MTNAIKSVTKRSQKGFTLIELLVVIAIIAILAALILAALSSAQKGARDSTRRSDINQIKVAEASYYADSGAYANTQAILSPPSGTKYLSKTLTPPAGSDASYTMFGDSDSFCVSIKSERDSSKVFMATQDGQVNNATANCTNADTNLP